MMGAEESSIAPVDKYALPISSGPSNSRPLVVARRLHRSAKSVSQATRTDSARPARSTETRVTATIKANVVAPTTNAEKRTSRVEKSTIATPLSLEELPAVESSSFDAAVPSPTDPKFDPSKNATHHAEGLSQIKRDRVQIPVDRKEDARRRLLERKQRKQLAG